MTFIFKRKISFSEIQPIYRSLFQLLKKYLIIKITLKLIFHNLSVYISIFTCEHLQQISYMYTYISFYK